MDKKPDITLQPVEAAAVPAIGSEQLKAFTKVLQDYNAGLAQTKSRVIASENWWKLRNTIEEQ